MPSSGRRMPSSTKDLPSVKIPALYQSALSFHALFFHALSFHASHFQPAVRMLPVTSQNLLFGSAETPPEYSAICLRTGSFNSFSNAFSACCFSCAFFKANCSASSTILRTHASSLGFCFHASFISSHSTSPNIAWMSKSSGEYGFPSFSDSDSSHSGSSCHVSCMSPNVCKVSPFSSNTSQKTGLLLPAATTIISKCMA